MTTRSDQGFTLIELLIVIAIIGVLAAIAIPTLLNALERSRQAQSVSIVMELGKSIERYIHDYPTIGAPRYDDVESLRDALNELELNLGDIKLIDGWHFELRYTYGDGDLHRLYTIESAGSDGEFNGLVSEPTDGEYIIRHFHEDIIWSRGRLVQYPVGVQTMDDN